MAIKAVGVVTVFAVALAFSQVSLSQEVLSDGQVIKIDEQSGLPTAPSKASA
jgi:hypothetical protein